MSPGAQPDANALIAEGKQLLMNGRPEEALSVFDRAAEIAPAHPETWGNRAIALADLERYEDAVESLQRSILLDEKDVGAWEYLGELLFHLRRLQEAAIAFSTAAALNPASEDGWAGLANVYLLLGESNKSLEAASNGLAAAPESIRLMRARLRALIDDERDTEALEAANELLERDLRDQRGSVLFFRGMALTNLGRFEDALKSIREAEELHAPQLGTLKHCIYLAKALNETGRAAEALAVIDSFDGSRESESSRALLALLRGGALNGLRRFEDARQTLSSLDLSAVPLVAAPEVARQRGTALLGTGRAAEALQETERGLLPETPPAFQTALLFLQGIALNALRRHQEALDSFDKVRGLQPVPPELWPFWLHYGSALNALGRFDEAEEPLRFAADGLAHGASQPDIQAGDVYLLLASVRFKLSDFAGALEALDAAITNSPPNARLLVHKGELLTQLGKRDVALDAFSRAVQMNPDLENDIDFWTTRAGAQLRLGISELSAPSPALKGHPWTLAVRGGALLLAGKIREAWTLFEKSEQVPASFEGDPRAWLGCGIGCVSVGKFERGLEALSRAEALLPEMKSRPEFAMYRALALQARGENDKALAVLADAPANHFLVPVKVLALGGMGRTEEALSVLESLKNSPDPALRRRVGSFRAGILMKRRSLSEALAELDAILPEEQHSLYRMLALSMKALVLFALRRNDEQARKNAFGLLAEAQELAASLPEGLPGRGLPWFGEGVLYSAIESHEKALLSYRRCERAERPPASLLVAMGQSLLALEDHAQALDYFGRAIAMSPDQAGVHAEAFIGQAVAYQRQQMYTEAVQAYRNALAENPEAAVAWTGLAEAYAALGKFEAATANFRQAMDYSCDPAFVAARAGWAFLRFRREKDALHFLEEAKGRGRGDAGIDFNRGVAFHRLRKPRQAHEAFTAAARSGSEEAETCLRELAARGSGPLAAVGRYWFGESHSQFRKPVGTVLIVLAAGGAILVLVKLAAVPWMSVSWPATLAPLAIAVGALVHPFVTSIKLGVAELKFPPIEPASSDRHGSLEEFMERYLWSATACAPLSTRVVADRAEPLEAPKIDPSRSLEWRLHQTAIRVEQ